MIKKLHLLIPAAALALFGGVVMLTSCTTDIDNPAAEVVDDKPFDRDQYIDASVRPGDDFFRYALGKWLADTETPGIVDETLSKIKDLYYQFNSNCTDSVILALRQRIDEADTHGTADIELLQSRIDLLSAITTQAELESAFTQLHQWGYAPLVRLICEDSSGVISPCLTSELPSNFVRDEMDNYNKEALSGQVDLVCSKLDKVGFNSERIAEISQHAQMVEILEVDAYDAMCDVNYLHKVLPPKRSLTRSAVPASHKRVCQLIGVDSLAHLLILNSYEDFSTALNPIIDLLLAGTDKSIATIRDYLIYYVFSHDVLFIPQMSSNIPNADRLIYALRYVKYYLFRLLVETYGRQNLPKQKCSEMMEEIRQVLLDRIDQLDWMSDATKQEAIKKARAMTFCIGYPDQWNDEYTPKIEGTTLLETISSLRRQSAGYFHNMVGRDMSTHGWDIWANIYPFTMLNAFYSFSSNLLFVMPAFLMPPMFDIQKSEATFYAINFCFAHEICHGFDSTGANYDENGAKRNWWMADDRAAFEQKQQQMISLWGQLEAYPGQPADGEKTLNENMADLGGVTLAYDTYKRRLKKQGFSGEQFDQQLRKFWLSCACLLVQDMKSERNIERMKWLYLYDTHSIGHNRVNGIVRLFDDWYRLFNVQPTDALYLAPEDRVRIW